ncbi:hypothetical protein GCM10009779_54670 [Polymorphospora rubra]|uniref:Uncharacterized protein n=1 Tax=Polymorphospora rubra TaxID=338584 RepID=A0A810N1H5_9ACTN|nr:hypothetical protein Prubr_35150 [Polymorphospora rubra]
MNPIRMSAGVVPATHNEMTTVTATPSGADTMNLIHEALSRARMRRPQAGKTTRTEATRSARTISMQARRQAARDIGGY